MVIRLLLSGLLFISTLLITFKGSAAEHINVISIKREPYVIVDHNQERGLTYDLIDVFNQVSRQIPLRSKNHPHSAST